MNCYLFNSTKNVFIHGSAIIAAPNKGTAIQMFKDECELNEEIYDTGLINVTTLLDVKCYNQRVITDTVDYVNPLDYV